MLREGRITRGQQRALDTLLPEYGLDPEAGTQVSGLAAGRRVLVEIGFGDGGALAELASNQPDDLFVGIEVHRAGVGNLLLQVEDRDLNNVRVYCHDAVDVLERCFEPDSIDRLHLFFPDPWPKKRHHKRRILSDPFISLVACRLKPGGVFHFATDWQDYAEQGLERLELCPRLVNQAGPGAWSARPDWRPETKFERRGQRLGHGVWDVLMERTSR